MCDETNELTSTFYCLRLDGWQVSDRIKTDSKGAEAPVSRFWACVFSPTIFALLWTQKMRKTLKWIPIFVLFVVVWFIIDVVSGDMLSDTSRSEDLVFSLSDTILVVYDRVIQIGSIALVVYFMFKWTTAYNLENFGYKSKREWKNATRA